MHDTKTLENHRALSSRSKAFYPTVSAAKNGKPHGCLAN